MTLFVT